jgi:pilus assembly protein CpaE
MSDSANSTSSNTLSVALVAPVATRRQTLVSVLAGTQLTVGKEYDTYPTASDMPDFAKARCGIVIVDLDNDAAHAIRAIGDICSRNPAVTVIAYSANTDSAHFMRLAMQAGARDFLIEPLSPAVIAEVFAHASAHRADNKKPPGKVLVFIPSKGGVGVTTIATNFALVLTRESGASVVVVDMDFELGEVALGLGMVTTFSVVDALQNPVRLDREFLSTFLLKHSSGLVVLGAPEPYNYYHAPPDGVGKLFQILREEFDYVVVDAGTCHSYIQETVFDLAATLYLVTEITFPALRNTHRIISFLSKMDRTGGTEVIINRANSRTGEIDEKSALKAIGRPVNWRIPNSYAIARSAQDTGNPLALEDSPITRVLTQMARAACGKPATAAGKRGSGFSFFGSTAGAKVVET